jgi:hypothetical protein
MNIVHSKALPLLVALAATLGGCVVAPVQPYYDGGPVVYTAPPVAQVEYIGVAPVPGYIWINGFWSWQANRHVWRGGHWAAPRPGHHWVPHAWSREGQGWRQHGGRWDRRGR